MSKKHCVLLLITGFLFFIAHGQTGMKWKDVSQQYGPLPASIQVFVTKDAIDGKPNIAFYVKARLHDKGLHFTTDTTSNRRLTPQQFYTKNSQPLVVVNTTFFSFATHQNLNAVVKNGKLIAYNVTTIKNRGNDTLTYTHPFSSAIGITKKRTADVAWLYTDSARKRAYAMQLPMYAIKDSIEQHAFKDMVKRTSVVKGHRGSMEPALKKWKVETAVGGGPVLVQNGEINITNNEERKFAGKAVEDKHPRTAMGYTKDGYLVILVVEGRNNGVAEGASLIQLAQMLKEIGCVEALNLDGGGSSSLLVNGKETIAPSDKTQRAVPAVFIIQNK
jgi:exopolysaccharide biosynthesis protein